MESDNGNQQPKRWQMTIRLKKDPENNARLLGPFGLVIEKCAYAKSYYYLKKGDRTISSHAKLGEARRALEALADPEALIDALVDLRHLAEEEVDYWEKSRNNWPGYAEGDRGWTAMMIERGLGLKHAAEYLTRSTGKARLAKRLAEATERNTKARKECERALQEARARRREEERKEREERERRWQAARARERSERSAGRVASVK